MPIRCSVCRNPKVQEINTALTKGEPERAIASRFSVSRPSVHRHKKCIAAAADEARRVSAVVSTATASDELARQRHRARKLEQAIDEWLTDPDDPERFNLSPRATEIPVIYFSTGDDGKPKRGKAKLSELLERVEKALGITVSYANTGDVADGRKLFVELMRATNSKVELLGKLSGEFISEKKHPDDAASESSRADSFKRLVEDLATKHSVRYELAEARLLELRPELKSWLQGNIVG